jgi:hypothetical protein
MRITIAFVALAFAGVAGAEPTFYAQPLGQQFSEATAKFTSEQRQPAWAEATENRIMEVVRTQDARLDNVQLECHAATCKLQFSFPTFDTHPDGLLKALEAVGLVTARAKDNVSGGASSWDIFVLTTRASPRP